MENIIFMNKKKIVILSSVIAVILMFSLCACTQQKTSRTEFCLNTIATVTIYGVSGNESNRIIDNCFDKISEYEKMFSATIESDISRVNEQSASNNTDSFKSIQISPETAKLIERGLYFGKITEGKFNIGIGALSSLWDFQGSKEPPSNDEIMKSIKYSKVSNINIDRDNVLVRNGVQIDLGAIAKGYIGDRIKEYIQSENVQSALIDLGGNITVVGENITSESKKWVIGIMKPFSEDSSVDYAVLVSKNNSVITSGKYQRYFEFKGKSYHHILSSDTGYPSESDLISASIIGADGADCDALSTTCILLGLEGSLELINNTEGYEAIFITIDGKYYFSNGVGMEEDKTVKILEVNQIAK